MRTQAPRPKQIVQFCSSENKAIESSMSSTLSSACATQPLTD